MDVFKVLYQSVQILDLQSTASIVATLPRVQHEWTRQWARYTRLTSSPSRSYAGRALRNEPRSLSTEEDIFPHQKSLGLRAITSVSIRVEQRVTRRDTHSSGLRSCPGEQPG